MKRILGLDLGTNSIGWALVEVDEDGKIIKILGIGSRIIPLSPDDANEFTTGKSITKNRKCTEKRTARKCFDRYQLRRLLLTIELRKFNMLPDERLIKLPVLDLWQLRAKAATKGNRLTLPELGRVLYHLNQKRGYKHAKSDESNDKNQREYVANVNTRYANIKQLGKTIGQFFAEKLEENQVITEKGKFYTYRIKDQVFPRKAYEEEFDQIMECQREFYPEILTDEFIDKVRNEIIYYQRKLKSCKHLVSLCEFEKRAYVNKDGKVVYDGPKVAPRTSPLFQVCKIWESVNNLKIKNRKNDELYITQEQRIAMFNFLNNNEKMTLTDMYKILKIDKSDGWWGGKAIGKGLQGNTTKMQLKKALSNCQNIDELLQFNLEIIDSNKIDEETGEVLKVIGPNYEHEPLYKLWHTIYSIQDRNELKNVLQKNWGITDETTLNSLFALDFVKSGYGNKSSKFIRKILPYLQDGMMYNEACAYIGINHSDSLTKAENDARELLEKLPQIKKNELRQPVVEKILNQMINVVNAVFDKYGKDDGIDEIRVELARELKQSREEREQTDKDNRKRQKENESNARLIEEYGIRASRNRIQKYRMWKESGQTCFYCGKVVDAKEFLSGYDVEVEHILPKALFFDDSFSNKVCSCRKCNSEKGGRTAYDYMSSKGEEVLSEYIRRVEDRYQKKEISKTKRERLLTPADKIPTDFINRQLRETQYIAKKSVEILKQVCRNVWTTSGSVTDFLRHNWGYDEILYTLDFDRYKSGGLTELVEIEHKGQKHIVERIKDWSKRLDHRHHAVDALVIACTKQSYIQRLNNLNAERDAMYQDVDAQNVEWKEKHSLLEKWIKLQPHPAVSEVMDKVAEILVSYKAGKRVATLGKRAIYKKGKKNIVQNNIVIPRGALSEDSVYGQINLIEKNKPIKYLFENPSLIFKPYIKALVEERLKEYNGDVSKAISSLKDNPIYLRKDKSIILEYGTCYKKEIVKKYDLSSIKTRVDDIIDNHIKEIIKKRLEDNNNNEKIAFVEPLYADKQKQIPIKSVRCKTGIAIVSPVKYNENNEPISFVKPGNNHHVAIYLDKDGKRQEHIVTFWHAVERKKYGLPVVITNPKEVWDFIIEKNLDLPESFLNCLPNSDWNYEISMQQNEMFIMGMNEEDFQDAIKNNDYKTLNKYLYRVQKISKSEYCFRHHIETSVDDKYNGEKNMMLSRQMEKLIFIKSIGALLDYNPHKVKITLLGEIQPL